jgi:hypothetical protein
MADSEINKIEYLSSLIKKAEFLADAEKEDFLKVLPNLKKEEIDEFVDFFLLAQKEMEEMSKKYKEKESEIFKVFILETNEAFQEAKKTIYRQKEVIVTKKEEGDSEKLLEELNNV